MFRLHRSAQSPMWTTADAPAGSPLPMSATDGIAAGMAVGADAIAGGTKVQNVSATTLAVAVTPPQQRPRCRPTRVVFTPSFEADLLQLVAAWLAYPSAIAGTPSSETYGSTDDATKFWPAAANSHVSAYLDLVLCALTQTYFIPAPFDVPLGEKIRAFAPSVSALAAVPAAQWTSFFRANPTWLRRSRSLATPTRESRPSCATLRNSSPSKPVVHQARSIWRLVKTRRTTPTARLLPCCRSLRPPAWLSE